MNNIKAKILRYNAIDIHSVFEKETELLNAIQQDQLTHALLLWQIEQKTLVLPSGNKWHTCPNLTEKLSQIGWDLYSRKTGGAPVPQIKGVLNVSYMYALENGQSYSIPKSYAEFCEPLSEFFKGYAVEVKTHATPDSYCDGNYNLNINGFKIVGTAQRVILKKNGGKIVLAQACILIEVDTSKLIEPVNLFYQHSKQLNRVKAEVHTCLFDHITKRPSTEALFDDLNRSFLSFQLNRG
jgi:lipoate-protein ligase A